MFWKQEHIPYTVFENNIRQTLSKANPVEIFEKQCPIVCLWKQTHALFCQNHNPIDLFEAQTLFLKKNNYPSDFFEKLLGLFWKKKDRQTDYAHVKILVNKILVKSNFLKNFFCLFVRSPAVRFGRNLGQMNRSSPLHLFWPLPDLISRQ